MQVNELENIKENAKPFINIWKDAHKNEKIQLNDGKEGKYCIITESLNNTFIDIFNALKYGYTDFVFVHGVSLNKNGTDDVAQAYGLLCTGIEDKSELEKQDCFFIGELYYESDDNEKCAVISPVQLENYLGENARYRLGKLMIVNAEDTQFIRMDSFLQALKMM